MNPADRVNILLVDDQPAKLLSYETILAELDENLIKANSGSDALRHLLRTEIAVVLVDVCMPDLDGFELTRMIREHPRLQKTAIILVSAVFMTDLDRLKGYHSGAVDYVPVPIIPEVLRAKVRVFADLYRKTEALLRFNAELEERVAQRTSDLQAFTARLKTSEERFRLALSASPITVYSHDRDLRYTWIYNPPPGLTVEAVVGKRDDELFPPEDVADLVALKRRVLETGEGERAQVETTCNGVRCILDVVVEPVRDADAQVSGLSIASTDITPIRAAEMAMRRSEEQFRILAETIPSLVWMADSHGALTYANARWYRYFGAEKAEMRAWAEQFVHHDDYERILEQWRDALVQGVEYEAELRMRRHDGMYRWFLARAMPRRDTDGRIVSWFGISTDIHEQKQLQEQLRETDRRKDEFLAMLAHELRNPLAPIQNAIEIMRSPAAVNDGQEWCREVIQRQTEHLTRLVDDLLDVSRITRGKITLQKNVVLVDAIVARAVELNRPLIESRGHQLVVEVASEPIPVEGDLVRLSQVVGNLLNNAAKYTEDGGTIRVAAAREPAPQPGESEQVVIRVSDTGIGIAPSMLPRVFDLFTQVDITVDRSQGGLGIGLSLVRSLVELHGGTVEARSRGTGQGSEFIVRLPLCSRAAPCEVEEPRKHGAGAGVAQVVLVADDNADSAESLALLLRCWGHEVHVASDGVEAVVAAERVKPSVALLDVGMPRMNGYDAARRIRSEPWGRDMLLVAQTGWSQDQDRRRTAEAGFDAHLTKPLDADALKQMLATLPQKQVARSRRAEAKAGAGELPSRSSEGDS